MAANIFAVLALLALSVSVATVQKHSIVQSYRQQQAFAVGTPPLSAMMFQQPFAIPQLPYLYNQFAIPQSPYLYNQLAIYLAVAIPLPYLYNQPAISQLPYFYNQLAISQLLYLYNQLAISQLPYLHNQSVKLEL
ncbi:hypothetical protein PVAP13_5NG315246 [Panicum virgatum]|uniref:Uncharacterized protein n=1 Tax=Panicum virgatum TaxID=38727 RepID=A0A8T0RZT0_PANVG|nr:hypothetical protein PVAP13_5NG315246 [Panicum virgatum]